MRTLFLKIFLWFWLAMALVVLALFTVTATTQSEPVIPPQRGLVADTLASHAHKAATIFERGGRPALIQYLRGFEYKAHIRAYLVNAQGKEVVGRKVPEGARTLVAQAALTEDAQFYLSGSTIFGAQRGVSASGNRYVFVGTMPRSLLSALRIPPRIRALRLLAVLLPAGLVCFGLARYLTAPVTRLRAAARQLAAGDLSARVGARSMRRRDELADLGRDFDLMAERIETLVLSQRRLLGDISHELRSPLARLNVALEIARRHAGAEAKAPLDRIERESGRLNELIGQLLALARLESGDAARHDEPVDLARLVNEVAADADFEARSRHKAVLVVRNEECWTMGTAEFLRSAVENVVHNAVRYTKEGTTVEITLRQQGKQPDNSWAVITVRDHGPGVPEAALPDLFRPFYRVADARDRQSGGAGLGLAIAERAIHSHGGTVTAANAVDGGLIVELRLPVTGEPRNPS
jgi:two-component system sensor histidine kinase CpxA